MFGQTGEGFGIPDSDSFETLFAGGEIKRFGVQGEAEIEIDAEALTVTMPIVQASIISDRRGDRNDLYVGGLVNRNPLAGTPLDTLLPADAGKTRVQIYGGLTAETVRNSRVSFKTVGVLSSLAVDVTAQGTLEIEGSARLLGQRASLTGTVNAAGRVHVVASIRRGGSRSILGATVGAYQSATFTFTGDLAQGICRRPFIGASTPREHAAFRSCSPV